MKKNIMGKILKQINIVLVFIFVIFLASCSGGSGGGSDDSSSTEQPINVSIHKPLPTKIIVSWEAHTENAYWEVYYSTTKGFDVADYPTSVAATEEIFSIESSEASLVIPNLEMEHDYYLRARKINGVFGDEIKTTTRSNSIPVITQNSTLVFNISEEVANGYEIALLDNYANDSDGDELEWEIIDGEADEISIDRSTSTANGTPINRLILSQNFDYEVKNNYALTLRVTDKATKKSTETNFSEIVYAEKTIGIEIKIQNVNEAPEFKVTESEFAVNENVASGDIGTMKAEDPEENNLTYTLLENPENKFSVNASGLVSFTAPFNYEDKNRFEIVVKVADDGVPSKSANISFYLNIMDVNEAPVLAGASSFDLIESTALNSKISSYTSEDPDQKDSVGWSLSGTDSDFFLIEDGNIFLKKAVDYYSTPIYHLEVKATDSYGLSATKTVDINIINVAEQVSNIKTSATNNSLLVDWKNANSSQTFNLYYSTNQTMSATQGTKISNITSPATIPSLNDNTTYYVVLEIQEPGGAENLYSSVYSQKTLQNGQVFLTSSASIGVTEGQTKVVDFTYENNNGESVSYEISGADSDLFEIGSTSSGSYLYFSQVPDADSGFCSDDYLCHITILPKTSSINGFAQDIVINILDVNDSLPEFLEHIKADNNAFILDENNTENGVFTTIIAIDADRDDSFNWELLSVNGNASQNLFSIGATNGRLIALKSFDYEGDSIKSYKLQIKLEDAASHSFSGTMEIEIKDINDAPNLLDENQIDGVISMEENAYASQEVTRLVAMDQDGDGFKWRIDSGNVDDVFSIDNSGYVKRTSLDNVISNGNYVLRLAVFDDHGDTTNATLSIHINYVFSDVTDLTKDANINFIDLSFKSSNVNQNYDIYYSTTDGAVSSNSATTDGGCLLPSCTSVENMGGDVKAKITSLISGTRYYFKIAINKFGEDFKFADSDGITQKEFVTLPNYSILLTKNGSSSVANLKVNGTEEAITNKNIKKSDNTVQGESYASSVAGVNKETVFVIINNPNPASGADKTSESIVLGEFASHDSMRSFLAHDMLTHNGSVFLVGGGIKNYDRKVVVANDYFNWKNVVKEDCPESFEKRNYHQAVEFNGDIYVIGGVSNSGVAFNDMWKYDDAGCFTKVTTTNSYTPRHGHQAVVHNGAIYVIGGIDNTFTKLSDVWKYDGSDWSKVSDGFALDSGGRVYHKAVSFGGKIYSVGGQGEQGYPYQIGGVYSDVLVSSDDGVTWSNALSDSAPNSEVSTYAKEDEYHVKEYWDSLNSDVTDTSIFDTSKYPKGKAGVFSSRTGHNLVVFDNKMWLIGGVSTEGNVMGGNDIYSSSDGISWTKERKTTLNTSGEEYRFSRRFDSAVVVNGTDIILVGGQKLDAGSNDKQNQVWISHDMIKWEQLVNYPVKF